MKKSSFFKSLPFKLLVGVVIGILAGLALNANDGTGLTNAILNIIVTLKYVLGQIISFCVPLIIIGFIAPSITKMGNNASRLLLLAVCIAYVSSVGAALFSTAAGYALIPHLSIVTDVGGLKELPEMVFELSIPQIMPVMSALVLSILLGLAAAWTKADLIAAFLDEFQKVVLAIVSRIIIPILPFFIGLTFCSLAYEGTITKQLPVFLKVIVIVLVGHFIWMTLLYVLAGVYSGENPLDIIKNYGPAYLTAVGTMSSAATLAVVPDRSHHRFGVLPLFKLHMHLQRHKVHHSGFDARGFVGGILHLVGAVGTVHINLVGLFHLCFSFPEMLCIIYLSICSTVMSTS